MLPVGSILLALTLTVLWGFSFVVIDYAFEAFPPILLAFIRVTATVLPIVVYVRPPRVPLKYFVALAVALGFLQYVCMFVGMRMGVPPGVASVLVQAQVFFTTALAFFVLKERPRAQQYVGIAIAGAGMLVIGLSMPSGGSIFGFLIILVMAAAWGASNIVFKLIGKVELFRLLVWVHLPAIPFIFALSYALEGGPAVFDRLAAADATHYLAGIFLGLVATGLGYLMWSTLMRRHSATLIAPFSLLIPVFGMTFMATLRGEAFGSLRLVGIVLVMTGLALCVVRLRGRPVVPASVALTLPEGVTIVPPATEPSPERPSAS